MDLHVLFPEELVARVDACLGPGQSRSDWIRRAVERALGDAKPRTVSSAPAEQPEESSRDEAHWRPGSSEERLLGLNVRPAREFRPYPKGGG